MNCLKIVGASLLLLSITTLATAKAGYDKTFYLEDQDGKYRLNFKGLTQLRYIYNQQSEREDEGVSGFELRRARLFFYGNTHNKNLKYKFMYNYGPSGGNGQLFDAFISYKYAENWTVTAGQFKLPFNREQGVGIGGQIGMDRTQVNYAFNLGSKGGRSQGVKLAFKNSENHLEFAFSDGMSGVNTAYNDDNPDWAFTSRYERLVSGKWKQFKSYSSRKIKDQGLLLGLGLHAEDGDTNKGTLDVTYKNNRFNFSAAAYARFLRKEDAPSTGNADQTGYMLQLGMLATNDVELFLRYESGDSDLYIGNDDTQPKEDTFDAIAFGGTKFLVGNKLKLTAEIHHALSEVPALFSKARQGFVTDSEEGQTMFRTQLHIIF